MADVDSSGQRVPDAFANAPERPVVQLVESKTTATDSKDSGEAKAASPQQDKVFQTSGVSKGRLLGWVVPVLGVVAGVAMYHQSPMLAVAMLGLAFVVGVAMLIGHWLRKRNVGSQDKSDRSGRSRRRRNEGRGFELWPPRKKKRADSTRGTGPGDGRSSGGRSWRDHLTRNNRRAGSNGPGKRGSDKATTKSPTAGNGRGSSTGATDLKDTGKRSFNPFRRQRKNDTTKTDTGKPASATKDSKGKNHTASTTGRESKQRWNPFRRNNTDTSTKTTKGSGGSGANPKGSSTADKSSSGTKPSWRQRRQERKAKQRQDSPGVKSGDTSTGKSKRIRDRKRNDAEQNGAAPGGGKTVVDGASGGGGKPRPRWWSKRRDSVTSQEPAVVESTDTAKNAGGGKKTKKSNQPETDPQQKSAKQQRRETDAVLREIGPVDDAGFPSPPVPKVKPERPVTPEPFAFDDCGFESPNTNTKPVVSGTSAVSSESQRLNEMVFPASTPVRESTTATQKERTVAYNETAYHYMGQVDDKAPATVVKTTLGEVAGRARVDAAAKDTEANELSAKADLLPDTKVFEDDKQTLLRKAADRAEDAETRRRIAGSMESLADRITA